MCSNTFISRRKRKTRNAQLVKKVKLKDGKDQFYPSNYYYYSKVIEKLERVLEQKGIPESCEEWRDQPQTEGTLSDVYSGQIWKDFQNYHENPFLSLPRNKGLMLNFDFFQPIKHCKDYSVGVLYLVPLMIQMGKCDSCWHCSLFRWSLSMSFCRWTPGSLDRCTTQV